MNVTPLRQSARSIGNWRQLPFFNNGQFTAVCWRLRAETRPILPVAGNILRAFDLTRRSRVRVVIVGQAPYPDPQCATGLAFAAPNTVGRPETLDRIFGKVPPMRQTKQDLLHWATRGVLLLNTTLTVPEGLGRGKYNEHDRIGWSFLVRQTIDSLVCRNDVFFMFFGVRAREMDIIPPNLSSNRMILTNHPVGGPPKSKKWSCFESFSSSDPFVKANQFFQSLRQRPIAW